MDVRPGDRLVSSGLGQRFPGGYPWRGGVGDQRPGKPFAVWVARPSAQFDRSRHCWWLPEAEAALPKTRLPKPQLPKPRLAQRCPPNRVFRHRAGGSAASRHVTRAWPRKAAVRPTSRASRCVAVTLTGAGALLVSLYPLPVWAAAGGRTCSALVVIFWVMRLAEGFRDRIGLAAGAAHGRARGRPCSAVRARALVVAYASICCGEEAALQPAASRCCWCSRCGHGPDPLSLGAEPAGSRDLEPGVPDGQPTGDLLLAAVRVRRATRPLFRKLEVVALTPRRGANEQVHADTSPRFLSRLGFARRPELFAAALPLRRLQVDIDETPQPARPRPGWCCAWRGRRPPRVRAW